MQKMKLRVPCAPESTNPELMSILAACLIFGANSYFDLILISSINTLTVIIILANSHSKYTLLLLEEVSGIFRVLLHINQNSAQYRHLNNQV
jgi:hypothetical protein